MDDIKKLPEDRAVRRKMLKSAISIGIAAAMAIGLCACGKSEADAGGENAGNALARENVELSKIPQTKLRNGRSCYEK